MGFLTGLVKTGLGVVLTPVAVLKDACDVVEGYEPEATVNVVSGTVESAIDSVESLLEGDLF